MADKKGTMELTRSQREIQKAAADFAKGEFDKALALDWDDQGVFPEVIWKKAAELGFIGLHWPEKYDGGGLGMLETALVAEAFCRRDSTLGCALALAGSGAEGLLHFGSETLREKYLPSLANAERSAAMAYGEPEVGAALSAVQTTAMSEDGGWCINGRKTYVLNGRSAGMFIVLARTTGERLSMFLVARDLPGVDVQDDGRKLGLNMTGTSTVRFTDVRIPADHLIGPEGSAPAQLDRFATATGISIAAQALGIAAGALDRSLAYIKARKAFSRKLAVFEITRHKIAEMVAAVETARLMVYQAAVKPDTVTAALARLTATRAAVAVADEAIQLFGGYGYMKESEVERFYRDAKTLSLLLGGQSALKRTIADSTIGPLK